MNDKLGVKLEQGHYVLVAQNGPYLQYGKVLSIGLLPREMAVVLLCVQGNNNQAAPWDLVPQTICSACRIVVVPSTGIPGHVLEKLDSHTVLLIGTKSPAPQQAEVPSPTPMEAARQSLSLMFEMLSAPQSGQVPGLPRRQMKTSPAPQPVYSPNQKLLRQLRAAPPGELSEKARKVLNKADVNTPSTIVEAFRIVHAMPETERSPFVAAVINPTWTSLPSYSKVPVYTKYEQSC